MSLKEIFQIGKDKRTYRRIGENYKVNIFLGYNENGQMSMVITEFGKEASVPSTKIIDVSLKLREDKRLALSFDLIDQTYESMFLVFCKDMILYCEQAGHSMAISSALIRWKYWREMFTRPKRAILDMNHIKGLIGELWFLQNYMIPKYDEQAAVESWRGPLLGHKDYEIDETWYEIKSVLESAIEVPISSLEQLDADTDGHLVIARLEETSPVNSLAIRLNELILSIYDMLNDPVTIALFQTRLSNAGYQFDEEYDAYNFVVKGCMVYKVADEFPRLCRSNVPNAIGKTSYTILINSIEPFAEERI